MESVLSLSLLSLNERILLRRARFIYHTFSSTARSARHTAAWWVHTHGATEPLFRILPAVLSRPHSQVMHVALLRDRRTSNHINPCCDILARLFSYTTHLPRHPHYCRGLLHAGLMNSLSRTRGINHLLRLLSLLLEGVAVMIELSEQIALSVHGSNAGPQCLASCMDACLMLLACLAIHQQTLEIKLITGLTSLQQLQFL